MFDSVECLIERFQGDDSFKPLLPNCSEEFKDFLKLCYERDLNKRPTAIQLLEHPFLRVEQVATTSEEDVYSVRDS